MTTPTTPTNKYKTVLCNKFPSCPYDDRCMFAHGKSELRIPECKYGKRCARKNCKFVHPWVFEQHAPVERTPLIVRLPVSIRHESMAEFPILPTSGTDDLRKKLAATKRSELLYPPAPIPELVHVPAPPKATLVVRPRGSKSEVKFDPHSPPTSPLSGKLDADFPVLPTTGVDEIRKKLDSIKKSESFDASKTGTPHIPSDRWGDDSDADSDK